MIRMHAVVAELYRVFKPYCLNNEWGGCSHCVTSNETERLRSTPLADLGTKDLDRYAFKAMTTWGSVVDFKYFVPRLLELAFDDLMSFENPEVLLGKLAYAKWDTWPSVERDAIQAYLNDLWKHQTLAPATVTDDERIRTALAGLAEACGSIEPFLAAWSMSRQETAALHLARFIAETADEIMTTGKVSLWGEATRASDEIVRWLGTDAITDVLEAHRESVARNVPLVWNMLAGIRAATR